MKKLLTMLLCGAIACSAMAFVGCGDSTFDGDYKEATAEQLTTLTADLAVKDVEFDTTAITTTAGYEITTSSKTTSTDEGVTSVSEGTSSAKMIKVGETVVAEGNWEDKNTSTVMGYETKVKSFYFDGSKIYMDVDGKQTAGGVEVPVKGKYFQNSSLRGVISNVGASAITQGSLGDLVGMAAMGGATVSMDMSDAAKTKVKVALTAKGIASMYTMAGVTESQVTVNKYEYTFIYDATTKAISSFQLVSDYAIASTYINVSGTLTVTVKAFNGTISAPSDLASYTAMPSMY